MFGADPRFGPTSREAVRRCLVEGRLIACNIVWAEVAGAFASAEAARAAMDGLNVDFDPGTTQVSLAAGRVWQLYRARGGKRTRMIPDFLIGSHAQLSADRLLSRDRGFYRSYFRDLPLFDPTSATRP